MRRAHVLVPLDGSPLSAAILPFVRGLPAPRITLVRAIERRLFQFEPDDPRESPAAAERDLAFVVAGLARAGIADAVALVRHGEPAAEILAAAAETGADLIAMTTHGRTGFDRLVLGSVAERVIRRSSIPVLAVRAREPGAPGAPVAPLFERALVPCDGSEASWRALDALALFDGERRSRVLVFGVVEALGGPIEIPPQRSSDPLVEYQRLRRESMEWDLARAVARARALGFEAEGAVEIGNPAACILDRAASFKATLVAMTTHGRSGPSRWALGSVTEKVLRAADVPLLICK